MNSAIPQIGTLVSVRDGTTRPPARFTKKLEKWGCRNYDGVLVELDIGTATVQHGDLFSPVIKYISSGVPLSNITSLEDEPSYYVERGVVTASREMVSQKLDP
jgi:hypothetical protein